MTFELEMLKSKCWDLQATLRAPWTMRAVAKLGEAGLDTRFETRTLALRDEADKLRVLMHSLDIMIADVNRSLDRITSLQA